MPINSSVIYLVLQSNEIWFIAIDKQETKSFSAMRIAEFSLLFQKDEKNKQKNAFSAEMHSWLNYIVAGKYILRI